MTIIGTSPDLSMVVNGRGDHCRVEYDSGKDRRLASILTEYGR